MKDTCKQTSQHRKAPRVELICTGGDQPKSRIRIFQHAVEEQKHGVFFAGDPNEWDQHWKEDEGVSGARSSF